MRSLGLGLVLLGCAAMASGEEVARSPGRQTLYDIRRLGTALEVWLMARTESLSAAERAAMEAKAEALVQAQKKAMVERGEWVDPATLTNEQILERLKKPLPRGRDFGEAEPLTTAQVKALLQPAGSKPLMEAIPLVDGWGRPIEVWGDLDNLLHHTVFAIRSAGANGRFDSPPYETGGFEVGSEADDIVWGDGSFFPWPLADASTLAPSLSGTLNGLEADDGL